MNAFLAGYTSFLHKEARDEKVVLVHRPERHRLPFRARAEVLAVKNGKLVARIVKGRAGEYIEFPGGGIDRGETPLQAVVREAREEAGLVLSHIRQAGEPQYFVFPPKMREGLVDWGRKYAGDFNHIFTARVEDISTPTSEEGDAWPKVSLLSFDEVIRFITKHPDERARNRIAAVLYLKQQGTMA